MKEIYFSVIIPLYNKEKDVFSTIDSVLKQTYSNYEIIVINDGSTDNGLKVVESICDSRLTIYSTVNKGVSSARNLGADYSKYDYLTFLDADDWWHPNHLDVLSNLIQLYPNEKWYSTSYDTLCKQNEKIASSWYNMQEKGWHGIINDFFKRNRTQWMINTCTICLKRNFFQDIGGFDKRLSCEEDIDLYIRLALVTPLVYSNIITMTVNFLGSNRTSDSDFRDKVSIDYKKYQLHTCKNKEFKQFLDFFRYTQYVKFMLASNTERAKIAKNGIDMKNLTILQRILVRMPKSILVLGIRIKDTLGIFNINVQVSKPKRT